VISSAISSGLGAGWRSNRVKICRVWDAVIAGVFPPDSPSFQAQEPQRHQAERHVVMPAHPAPDLVMIEPDLTLAGSQHLLDPVSLPPGPDHPGQRDLGVGVAQGVVDPRLAHRTDHHQELFRTDPPLLLGPDTALG
jgi:hypothetical protein